MVIAFSKGGDGRGDKWLDLEYSWMIELTGFPEGLGVGAERKRQGCHLFSQFCHFGSWEGMGRNRLDIL